MVGGIQAASYKHQHNLETEGTYAIKSKIAHSQAETNAMN